jgi:carbonic anhydrase
LVNNGHTAQLNLKGQYVIKNVAPQSENYKVEQIHFHWGHANDNINGSEHLYEGKAYPLEMHIVSYSNWYSSISDAMTNTRSLAVVGLFFELSEEPNELLQPLVDGLANIRNQGEKTPISDKFNLKKLVDEHRLLRYYRYDGSLTTPPCYESVIWTVAIDPLKLSLSQLHAFRYLHNNEAKLIENTYRKVQPLGTRLLFRSFLSENIYQDYKQRSSIVDSGHHLINNVKLMIILISLLKIIF